MIKCKIIESDSTEIESKLRLKKINIIEKGRPMYPVTCIYTYIYIYIYMYMYENGALPQL